MKIKEITSEDYLHTESADDTVDDELSTLSTLLGFLAGRITDSDATPKVKTVSLLSMMRKLGFTGFTYQGLVAAHEKDDSIKNQIKSFSKDEIILNTGDDDSSYTSDADAPKQDPAKTVASMAKRQINK